jgi:hypothetical protein
MLLKPITLRPNQFDTGTRTPVYCGEVRMGYIYRGMQCDHHITEFDWGLADHERTSERLDSDEACLEWFDKRIKEFIEELTEVSQ